MTTANLAVADNETVVQYTSVGESEFDFPFPILSSSELKVSVNGSLKTVGVDYTVSGVGDSAGGSIEFNDPTTAGQLVTLWLDMPIQRVTGFSLGAATLLPQALNSEFARNTRIDQMLRRDIRRSLRVPVDDAEAGQDLELPTASVRANKYLRFGAGGNPEVAEQLEEGTTLSLSAIGGYLYPQTPAELALGITPSRIWYPEGNVLRYGAIDSNSSLDAGTNGNAIRNAARVIAEKGGGTVFFPFTQTGIYRFTGTLYFYGHYVRFEGDSLGCTLHKTDAGTAISADPDTHTVGVYRYYTFCELKSLSGYSETADIFLDFTGFSYSRFCEFSFQIKGSDKKIIMGKGHQGSSPYYNVFDSFSIFGDSIAPGSSGSVGVSLEEGDWTGGSNGPNSNYFANLKRAAALWGMFDIRAGQGNHGTLLSGESITEFYFRFNYRAAPDDSGTSTGSNTDVELKDSGAGWTVSQWLGAGVKITAGTGAGQIRAVASNTSTTLVIERPWTTIPDATSEYEIYIRKCAENRFSHIRGEGSADYDPDFVQSYPGAMGCSVRDHVIQSLGGGQMVVDPQKDPSNHYWDGDLIQLVFLSTGQAAGATVDLTPAIGAAFYQGGYGFTRPFVVEEVSASCMGATGGVADITVKVDSSYDIELQLGPTQQWFAWAPGVNTSVFGVGRKITCQVVTDGSWSSTGADIAVQVTVRLQ